MKQNDDGVKDFIDEIHATIEAERSEYDGRDIDDVEDIMPWPTLSRDALYPGLIRTFVDAATVHSEADPAAVLGSFLVRLSVEVGRNPYLMIGDDRQHCNLLAAIVGPSGNGRKGTSLKPVMRAFPKTDDTYQAARWTPGPLSSGEGIIWAVRDEILTWEKGKKGEPGALVVTDPGVDDKRLFVATEELSSAFSAMSREGNTLSAVIRQIFDTGTLDPLTKTSKCKATGAHIGILGHITTFELSELLKECQVQNGLVNRFLWLCSRRQKIEPFPKPMSDADLEDFRAIIRDIVDFAARTEEMTLDVEAKDLWRDVYPALSQPQEGFLAVVLERAPVLVLRLSTLHALCDCSERINVDHIRAALAVWEYCQDSAKYIFDSRRMPDPLAEKILTALQAGPKSLTEIHKAMQGHSKGLRGSIQRLIERGKIDCDVIRTGSKPRTVYKLR